MVHYIPLIALTIIIVILMITGFLAWYFYMRARNKERMYLLEKGENMEELLRHKAFQTSFPWLKLGIVIIGLSIGMGILTIIEMFGPPPGTELRRFASSDTFYLFVLGLSGGISMVISHYIGKYNQQK